METMTTTTPEVILDAEITAQLAPLAQADRDALVASLAQYLTTLRGWLATAEQINVTDATQVREMKAAREARLALKKIRVESEKLRKDMVDESTRKTTAINSVFRLIKARIEPAEARMQEAEDFAVRAEAARLAQLKADRIAELTPLVSDAYSLAGYPLDTMSAQAYEELKAGMVAAKAAREAEAERLRAQAEAARKAEEERRERERRDMEEARARAEAEAAAARKAAEEARIRAEEEARARAAERAIAEEAARKAAALREQERRAAEQAAAAERARAEAERKKLEAELEAQRQAERARAEAERRKAEEAEAARRAAEQADDKTKLAAYRDALRTIGRPSLADKILREKFAGALKRFGDDLREIIGN